MSLAGLDIGTTGCKLIVYASDGRCLYSSYCDYPVSRSAGEHEINAEYIWHGIKTVLSDAAKKHPDIEAIGISSFGECCVLLDQEDKPLRPAMLCTDPRGEEECRTLVDRLGAQTITDIAGVSPHSMYSLPKVMWVKKHYPETYSKTRRILLMEDYAVYMLTGTACIDYSLAIRTMAFDIGSLTWSDRIFEAAGIDKELFSEPVLSGTKAGTLRESAARELGLCAGTIVVPAGHDQFASAIGSGVFESECAVDSAGTVECITCVYDIIPDGSIMGKSGYAIVPYVVPGKYITYAFSFTGGALVAWFINNLAKAEKLLAKEQGRTVYEILEQDMKQEPTGILVLPHFAGAATPYLDEHSKGAIVGLTVEHTASDLYRAMMEGVAYEMHINLDRLNEAGIYPKRLRAVGGGAASGVWMQMKADILGLPITSFGNAEAGAAGCAIMGGICAGVFQNMEAASRMLMHEKDTYYPREQQHLAYMKYYEKYKQLYPAVRPLV